MRRRPLGCAAGAGPVDRLANEWNARHGDAISDMGASETALSNTTWWETCHCHMMEMAQPTETAHDKCVAGCARARCVKMSAPVSRNMLAWRDMARHSTMKHTSTCVRRRAKTTHVANNKRFYDMAQANKRRDAHESTPPDREPRLNKPAANNPARETNA